MGLHCGGEEGEGLMRAAAHVIAAALLLVGLITVMRSMPNEAERNRQLHLQLPFSK